MPEGFFDEDEYQRLLDQSSAPFGIVPQFYEGVAYDVRRRAMEEQGLLDQGQIGRNPKAEELARRIAARRGVAYKPALAEPEPAEITYFVNPETGEKLSSPLVIRGGEIVQAPPELMQIDIPEEGLDINIVVEDKPAVAHIDKEGNVSIDNELVGTYNIKTDQFFPLEKTLPEKIGSVLVGSGYNAITFALGLVAGLHATARTLAAEYWTMGTGVKSPTVAFPPEIPPEARKDQLEVEKLILAYESPEASERKFWNTHPAPETREQWEKDIEVINKVVDSRWGGARKKAEERKEELSKIWGGKNLIQIINELGAGMLSGEEATFPGYEAMYEAASERAPVGLLGATELLIEAPFYMIAPTIGGLRGTALAFSGLSRTNMIRILVSKGIGTQLSLRNISATGLKAILAQNGIVISEYPLALKTLGLAASKALAPAAWVEAAPGKALGWAAQNAPKVFARSTQPLIQKLVRKGLLPTDEADTFSVKLSTKIQEIAEKSKAGELTPKETKELVQKSIDDAFESINKEFIDTPISVEQLLGRAPSKSWTQAQKESYRVYHKAKDYLSAVMEYSVREAIHTKNPFAYNKEGWVVANSAIRAMPGKTLFPNKFDIIQIIENTKNFIFSKDAEKFINILKDAKKLHERLADAYGIPYNKTILDQFFRYVIGKKGIPLSRAQGYYSGIGKVTGRKRYWQDAELGRMLSELDYSPNPVHNLIWAFEGLIERIARKKAAEVLAPFAATKESAKLLTDATGVFGTPIKFGAIEVTNWMGIKKTISGSEAVRLLENKFGEKVSAPLKFAVDVASLMRTSKASMDDSALTIQLALMLGLHPKEVGEGFVASLRTLFADQHFITKFLDNPENARSFLQFAYHSGLLTSSEYMEGTTVVAKLLGKIPRVGATLSGLTDKSLGRFNDVFTNARTVAVVKIWEAMYPTAHRQGMERELASFLNRSTGYFSLGGAGIGANWRAAMNAFGFFAPRFTLATASLALDIPKLLLATPFRLQADIIGSYMLKNPTMATLGIKALQKDSWKAWQLLRHLGALYLGGTAMYLAVAEATGQTPKIDLRPKSMGGDGADAYSIQIGESRIRMLGGMYNLARMMLAVGLSVKEGDWQNTMMWTVRGIKSRTAMTTGTLIDLFAGKDYIGEPTGLSIKDWDLYDATALRKYLTGQLTPIWTESVIEAKERGEPLDILLAVGAAEFFGGQAWRDDLWNVVEFQRAQIIKRIIEGRVALDEPLTILQITKIKEEGGLTWTDLNRAQREEIRRKFQQVREAEEAATTDSKQRYGDPTDLAADLVYDEFKKERNEKITNIVNSFRDGIATPEDFRENLKEARLIASSKSQGVWSFEEKIGLVKAEDIEKAKEKWAIEDRVLAGYQEIIANPISDPYDSANWTKTFEEADKWLSQYDQSVYDYVKRNYQKWVLEQEPDTRELLEKYYSAIDYIDKIGYWKLNESVLYPLDPKKNQQWITKQKLDMRKRDYWLDIYLNFWFSSTVVRSTGAWTLLKEYAEDIGRPSGSIPALTKNPILK